MNAGNGYRSGDNSHADHYVKLFAGYDYWTMMVDEGGCSYHKPKPANAEEHFAGWSTSIDGSSMIGCDLQFYKTSKDITLYAVYDKNTDDTSIGK